MDDFSHRIGGVMRGYRLSTDALLSLRKADEVFYGKGVGDVLGGGNGLKEWNRYI